MMLMAIGLLSLCGCVRERDPFAGCAGVPIQCASSPYPPLGLGLMEPMPTGVVPYGTLTPSVIQGQYWVTGQPTGTVHAR